MSQGEATEFISKLNEELSANPQWVSDFFSRESPKAMQRKMMEFGLERTNIQFKYDLEGPNGYLCDVEIGVKIGGLNH